MPVQNRAKRYNDRFARVLLGVQKVKVSITYSRIIKTGNISAS